MFKHMYCMYTVDSCRDLRYVTYTSLRYYEMNLLYIIIYIYIGVDSNESNMKVQVHFLWIHQKLNRSLPTDP